jgi:hypothetical protein
MPIPVELYIEGGVVRGEYTREGHLRQALEGGSRVPLERANVVLRDAPPRLEPALTLDVDDVLLASEPLDAIGPVHALWHPLHLVVGPYRVDGEMPTMPGFDPAKALARPTGEFVLLRDARIALASDPEAVVATHPALMVNRYAVERVEADLMLGFFFPGAEMAVDESLHGAAAHPEPGEGTPGA